MNEGTQAASPSGTTAAGQAATTQTGTPTAQGDGTAAAATGQGTTATSTQGTTAAATTTATTAAATQPVVPDRYELRIPDQSPLQQADLDDLAAMAKRRGWTQEQATVALTEMHDTLSSQIRTFRTELEADREVGGAQLEAAQTLARQVLDRFLPENEPDGQRLRAAFNKSGYGNWTPIVKVFARIGKAMGEDRPHQGLFTSQSSAPRRSHAEVLFGDAQGTQRST